MLNLVRRATILALLASSVAFAGSHSTCTTHSALSEVNRAISVAALTRRVPTETHVELLASKGCLTSVEREIRRVGAIVRFVDSRTGYIYASVQSDHLLDVFEMGGLDVAGVEETFTSVIDSTPLDKPLPEPVPTFRLPIPSVAMKLSTEGPYFPADEGGLTALREDHPDADGRNTRIALIDTGVDLLHPAFMKVKNSAGNLLPKVVDLGIPASTPQSDNAWVTFGAPLMPVDNKMTFAGRLWTVPAGGPYRIGIFARKFSPGYSELEGYGVGNPDAEKFKISVGVLWDPKENVVWVDTDGDGDFTNNRRLADYSQHQDIDWFGTKIGDQDNRIPFGIKIVPSENAVYLGIGGFHGTLVAGTAAANTLTGGLFDGAAPMAQLVDIQDTSHPLLQLAQWASRPEVDVISRSGVYSDPGVRSEDHQKLILERFIEVYGKPVVCYCAAAGAIHVLDYQSPEMLRRNRQAPPPYTDAMNSSVWFTKDGLLNSVVAPSVSLTAQVRFDPLLYVGNDGRTHWTPDLLNTPAPPGYMVSYNPSPAISYTSGVIASVLSLAKRRNVRYDALRVSNALFISSKLVSGFPASVQGHGLIDAKAMWQQLEEMAKGDDPGNAILTSFEVWREREVGKRTRVYGYSEEFTRPDSKGRNAEIWVVRRGGHAGSRRYQLTLRGDNGAFALKLSSVDLPRDTAVCIPFTAMSLPNLHVAFLQLRDAEARVVMQEIPLQTKTAQPMESIAPGIERFHTQIEPRHVDFRYFATDESAQAVRLSMEIPYDGGSGKENTSVRGWWLQPDGLVAAFSEDLSLSKTTGAPVDAVHYVGPNEVFESIITEHLRGLWTLEWGNRSNAEYETPYSNPAPDVPIPATLTVTNYRVSFDGSDEGKVTLHNELADVNGRVEFLTGRVFTQNLTGSGPHGFISAATQIERETAVWRIAVDSSTGSVSGHVFALDCTGKDGCQVVQQTPLQNGQATITVSEPQAGEWRVAILPDAPTHAQSIELKQLELKSASNSGDFRGFSHAATVQVIMPSVYAEGSSSEDPIYAAFRLAPHVDGKAVSLIAVTPITKGAF